MMAAPAGEELLQMAKKDYVASLPDQVRGVGLGLVWG